MRSRLSAMSRLRAAIRTVWSFFATILRDVIVDPVRDGTLKLRDHPPAIAGIVWVVAAAAGITIAGIVFANPLRTHSEVIAVVDESGSSIVPAFLVPAILFVLALAIALVLAGSQRMRLWLRVVLFLACTGVLGDLIASSTTAGQSRSWLPWITLTMLVAYCFLMWAGRTRIAADFFILLVLSMVITLWSYHGFVSGNALMDARFDLVAMSTLMTTLNALAMPAAFGSGLSAAQLGVSLAVQTGVFAARRTTIVAASIVLVAVIAHQFVFSAMDLGERWSAVGPVDVLGAAAGATLIVGLCVLVWWLVHRACGRWTVVEDGVSEIASTAALPIGYALMAPLLISTAIAIFGATLTLGGSAAVQSRVVALVHAFGGETAVTTARVGVIIGLVATGGWMVHRRRPRAAAVFLIDAVMLAAMIFAVSRMRAAHVNWSVEDLGNIGLVIGTVLFGYWVLRRAITPDRLVLVYSIVLLSALVRRADYFDLPFGFLIGGSAVALLLIGLVWGFLTGGAGTHEDRPHSPRDASLLLFLGTFLFSIATLAWSTIGKQVELARELSGKAALGLVTLGTGYVIVCVLDTVHSWRRASRVRRNLC